jgi:hypothetical protein
MKLFVRATAAWRKLLPSAAVVVIWSLSLAGDLVNAQRSAQGSDDLTTNVVELGQRRELFVDEFLIDSQEGVSLRLQQPVPQEIAITFDEPNEGNISYYVRIFRDGDVVRMYYRGAHYDWPSRTTTHQVVCYAESKDGVDWIKPKLGLFQFEGSKDNNIVWMGVGSHNFSPFRDTNPDCKPEDQYKALGSGNGGLVAFASPDGIHWRPIKEEPVITKGAFDSQNLAFWDQHRGRYVDFHRGFSEGVRGIMTSTTWDPAICGVTHCVSMGLSRSMRPSLEGNSSPSH